MQCFITYKTILQGLVIQRVQGRKYDISAGQHQPTSGLLRKTRIYMVFILSTVESLLSGHPRGNGKWPLNRGLTELV